MQKLLTRRVARETARHCAMPIGHKIYRMTTLNGVRKTIYLRGYNREKQRQKRARDKADRDAMENISPPQYGWCSPKPTSTKVQTPGFEAVAAAATAQSYVHLRLSRGCCARLWVIYSPAVQICSRLPQWKRQLRCSRRRLGRKWQRRIDWSVVVLERGDV